MSGEAHSVAHLAPGYVVGGKYVIKRLLGEGANGSVYEGEHSEIGHRVAIKVVHKALAARDDIIARFRREARICGTIRNRHVGQVYDVGQLQDGAPFMVMELHEGRSLAQQLTTDGPPSIATAVDYGCQLLIGLQAAHDTGAIHRDIKPDNLMIVHESNGQTVVKLVDFGIGKSMTGDISTRNVTQEGMVVGSPDYMPPEQLRGDKVDQRVDIYAAGVVLYELVAGRMPFNAHSLTELFVAILRDPIAAPIALRPDCPPELEAVILRALARDANDRFQSAREMEQALAEVQRMYRMRAGDPSNRYSAPPPSSTRVQTQTRRAASTTHDYALETERVRTAELQVPIQRHGSRAVFGGIALLVGAVLVVWVMRSGRDETPRDTAPAPPHAASVNVATPVPAPTAAPTPAPAAVAPAAQAALPAAPEPSEPAAVPAQPPVAVESAPHAQQLAAHGKKHGTPQAEPTAPPSAPVARPAAPEPTPAVAAGDANSTADLVKQASAAFVFGQLPRARALYRDATERAPSNADAWRGLGMVSSRMGERGEATRAFNRYLALRPNAADSDAIRKKLEEQ